jgi:chromosome partitioning protein
MTPTPAKVTTVTTPPQLTVLLGNQKGGVGKTTLATNLGAAAHLAGHRTIVLDLDPQGSATDWYAARREWSPLEGLTVSRCDRVLTLPRFRELTHGYDVAVIDGPPRLGDILRAAAVAADVVLVPLRPGAFDWWAAAETLTLLDSADAIREQLGRAPARRMFVLNAAAERTRIAKAALEALGQVGELAPVVIASRVVYASAATWGESVMTVTPVSREAVTRATAAAESPLPALVDVDSAATDEIGRLWRALAEHETAEGERHG